MRSLLAAVFLLLGCDCMHGNVALLQPSDPMTRMNESTAVLVGYDSAGSVTGVCSGVFVTQVEILTAAHCTGLAFPEESEDADPIARPIAYFTRHDVAGKDLEEARPTGRAIVVAVDPAHDLALLSVGGRNDHGIAILDTGEIYQGEHVWTMGHTYGLAFSASDGVIGADRELEHHGHKMHVLQVVSGANFGNSGGGVWNDDGELLGIASFRIRDSALTFFIHRDEVAAFLAREGLTS
jgi:S1-C subfamily serine protease